MVDHIFFKRVLRNGLVQPRLAYSIKKKQEKGIWNSVRMHNIWNAEWCTGCRVAMEGR